MGRPLDHIILSRTDSIGDVMLTLPSAGLLKERHPGARITFIGRRYTQPVLSRCVHVDESIALEDLLDVGDAGAISRLAALRASAIVHVFPERRMAAWAKHAGIGLRIGTSHRWWHWLTCNERISLTRRRSDLHEAQLNAKLLAPLGITSVPALGELAALSGFSPPRPEASIAALLRPDRINVVLHPLSKGSAVEWGLDRYAALIMALDPQRHHAIVTGTAAEAERYRAALPLSLGHVTDAGGRCDLHQLIALIGASQAMVAASTGPLHIAAACGITAIGLFADVRPIHPGRWGPIGARAHPLVARQPQDSRDAKALIHAITPQQVLALLPR